MNEHATAQTGRGAVPQSTVPTGFHLQRKCACGSYGNSGECDKCRKESSGLQRSACNVAAPATVPRIVQEVLSSPGQPLDHGTRSWLEPKFGHDFSQVRVHTDQKAAESAEAVNAIAYTVGPDVVFGASHYEPRTQVGSHLLAHELTHVVQQSNSNSLAAQNAKPVSDPSDAAELEAESAARRAMGGDTVSILQPPSATLHALSGGEWAAIGGGAALVGLGIAWLAGAFDPEHYSDAELTDYLTSLATNRRIQGATKSDNKARDVVRRWAGGNAAFNLDNGFRSAQGSLTSIEVKRLLIEEMLDGPTLDADEKSIITILRRSADRQQIVNAIGRARIWDDFSGQNRRIVEAITLTDIEFNDQALVDRLKALPADDLTDYRDNAVDPAVKARIEAILQLQAITTPLDITTPFSAGGVAHPVVPGFDVSILPDTTSQDEAMRNQAHTSVEVDANPAVPEHINTKGGLIDSMDPVGNVRITIRTTYGPGAQSSSESAYGRGTTQEDISAGRTSLGFHEGNHGLDYLEFLRNNPPPRFTAQEGQPEAEVQRAQEQFRRDVDDFNQRIARFTAQRTECVGKPFPVEIAREFYHDEAICAHVGGGH